MKKFLAYIHFTWKIPVADDDNDKHQDEILF